MPYLIKSNFSDQIYLEEDLDKATVMDKIATKDFGKEFYVISPSNYPKSMDLMVKVHQFGMALETIGYDNPGDQMGQDAGFFQCWEKVEKKFKEIFGE